MPEQTIGVIGGSGFVGLHLANHLVAAGHRLRVLTRRRASARALWVLPTVDVIEADVHDPTQLERHLAGSDAVLQLAGILNERGDDGRGFRRVHVELPQKVVAACRFLGIRRYLHMSALNAHPDGPSHYLKSKGEAEDWVHAQANPDFLVTSFRPSVIFGPGDSFYNRFAGLLGMTPLVFPLACPEARFQPVWVGNVAEAFERALLDPATAGERLDLCGPTVNTLREIVEYTARTLGLRRWVIPLSDRLSRLQAEVFEHLPGKPFSRDNYRSTREDSVCRGDCGLRRLGITPVAVEAVVPGYLANRNARGRLAALRAWAGRR
jgi:NADH dehydrogenase